MIHNLPENTPMLVRLGSDQAPKGFARLVFDGEELKTERSEDWRTWEGARFDV